MCVCVCVCVCVERESSLCVYVYREVCVCARLRLCAYAGSYCKPAIQGSLQGFREPGGLMRGWSRRHGGGSECDALIQRSYSKDPTANTQGL